MASKVDYSFHEVCYLFPEMSDQQIDELAEDIKTNGQIVPIVIHQGKIIDGRHRYVACGRAGVEPIVREWDGHGSLVAHVIGLNKIRRQLTPSQLAMVAAKAKPLFEDEAKARQKSGKKASGTLPSVEGKVRKGTSAAAAAKSVGAAESSVERADRVLKSGDDELVKAVESGDLSLRAAEKAVKEKKNPKPAEEVPAVKDGLGRKVPERFLPHFTSGAEKFDRFRKLMIEASRLVGEMSEEPWGAFIHAQSVKSDLANAKRGVGHAEPFTVCPFCSGSGCSGCRHSGVATKMLWENRDKSGE